MTKLNDLQLILLSHAARTSDGNVLPLPDTVADRDRAYKDLKAILRRGLVAETQTATRATSWRSDDSIHFGLVITEAGSAAIGLGTPDAQPGADATDNTPATRPGDTAGTARSGSKIANVLTLLGRDDGATLAELVEATGWLPHTTRSGGFWG